ncbi:hypothetical protein [Hyphomicrobium sp.]|uniref:hypothetical protein n=1 Tax=Hyphomicrobium sp. TaxID=82 RepID=UPI003F715456
MGALNEDQHVRRGGLVPNNHRRGGRAKNDKHGFLGLKSDQIAYDGLRTQNRRGMSAADIQSTAIQSEANACGVFAVALKALLNAGRLRFPRQAKGGEVALAAATEDNHLDGLAAFERAEFDAIAFVEFKAGCSASLQHETFNTRIERGTAGHEDLRPGA